MKFKSLLVSLVFALGAPAAFAQSCTSTSNLGSLGSSDSLFGNWFSSAQSFNDCYSFTLGNGSDVSGLTAELDLSLKLDLDITSVSLFGSTGTPILTGGNGGFSFDNLAADTYQLVVSGDVSRVANFGTLFGVGYGGAVSASPSITAPVPEPETYAMLAMGLGLVSWVTRRRNRA